MESGTFYTSEQYFLNRLEKVGRQMRLEANTREEFFLWKKNLVNKLTEVIGMNTMESCDLEPQLLEHIDCGDYWRDKIVLQTEPGVRMPLYVLMPKTTSPVRKVPVICCHGHASGGKVSVAGVAENPLIRQAIEEYNYDYGVQLVREGFITFCPDARGFGERRERPMQSDEPEKFLHGSCTILNRWGMVLGQSVIGMWVWDLKRLIDYIETREDCDIDRLGCVGLSGGGFQTLWLTALDDRVKAAVSSGYFYGFSEAMLEMYQCSCNYAPHIWEYVDAGDIGALIAPRPFVVETGNRDLLNGRSNLENVYSQTEITRRAYRLFDAENAFVHDVFDGPHRWHGTVSVKVLKDVLEPEK